jgi:hypothetical protein
MHTRHIGKAFVTQAAGTLSWCAMIDNFGCTALYLSYVKMPHARRAEILSFEAAIKRGWPLGVGVDLWTRSNSSGS